MKKSVRLLGSAVVLILAASQAESASFYYRHPLHGLSASGPVNAPPTIHGAVDLTGEVGETIMPLTGVTVVDPENTTLTVTVEILDRAAGSLSESLESPLVGTGAAVSSKLQNAVFTPTAGRLDDGDSEDVTLKISAVDGAGAFTTETIVLTVQAPVPEAVGSVIWASGFNMFGNLGLGDFVNRSIPEASSLRKNWQRISTNHYNQGHHHAALTKEGELWTWGYNSFGQLGVNTTINSAVPVMVSATNPWTYVGVGTSATIGLQSDGTLWGWGRNTMNGLGGTTSWRPRKISNGWKALSVGHGHVLAVKTNGTLWSWGYGDAQCLGGMSSHDTPTQVASDNDWKNVYTGNNVSFMVKNNGSLWACGSNANYELGLGVAGNRTLPAQVGSDNDWQHIAVGYSHVLGLKTDGSLWAWGRNNKSQTGIPGPWHEPIKIPTRVGADQDWIVVSAGEVASMAIKEDGSLWGWGEGGEEMLGFPSASTPVRLGTENTWQSVAHGYSNSFAIKGAP